MTKVIIPGSFDPPTLGHLNIIQRAANIFDYVYVAIGYNSEKGDTAFSPDERVNLLKLITQSMSNVEIVAFHGLLVDYAQQVGVQVIIRSIRHLSDFDEETVQAQMNRQLGHVETLYLMPDEKFRLVSSSLIREIARHGKRLHNFVPAEIENMIFEKLKNRE